jgi:hypothetical protein
MANRYLSRLYLFIIKTFLCVFAYNQTITLSVSNLPNPGLQELFCKAIYGDGGTKAGIIYVAEHDIQIKIDKRAIHRTNFDNG